MDDNSHNFVLVTTVDEIETVVALAKIIWVEHYSKIIGLEQVNYMLGIFLSKAAIQDDIQNKRFKYYLQQHDGQNVGYLAFQIQDDSLFLSKLYILSSQRKQGLGAGALAFICSQAARSNATRINLTVNKHNTGSIAAYERIGFRTTGDIKADIGNGFYMDDLAMEWRF